MRHAYELCEKHSKRYCTDRKCKAEERDGDNSGSLSVNSNGDPSLGLGGGLALDLTDGSIGIQVGGFTIDT